MSKIKNILFPTDFSEGFIHNLNYILEIARPLEATLHIIHVIEPIAFSFQIVVTNYGLDKLPDELEALAKKDMEKIEKLMADKNVAFSTKVIHGKAYVEILGYAQKNHIDMICIATSGHGNLENLIFGSTTEKVLRTATCPVLVVRSKE